MNTTTNTIELRGCPTCEGPAQAIAEGEGVRYRHVDLRQATNTRGVSEAMVAELIAAGDFLAMNGTDGMVRRWEKAKAALSAQPAAQGDAVATVHRMGNCVGQLVYCEFGLNSDLPHGTKLYTAPPAQPAERVPEEITPEEVVAHSMGGCQWGLSGAITFARGWNACRDAMLTATPAPSDGGKGVDRE